MEKRPDLIIVVGDVNSVLACTVVAAGPHRIVKILKERM